MIENVWERRVYLGDVQGQWTEACAATGTANNDNGLAIAHCENSGGQSQARQGKGREERKRRSRCVMIEKPLGLCFLGGGTRGANQWSAVRE